MPIEPDTDLAQLQRDLYDSGLPIVSLKEFSANPDLQQKLKKWRINKYLKIAAAESEDPNLVIRMVASLASGRSKEDWNNDFTIGFPSLYYRGYP